MEFCIFRNLTSTFLFPNKYILTKAGQKVGKASSAVTLLVLIILAINARTIFLSAQTGVAFNNTPEKLYGKLFYDVQEGAVFADSKTFVDCIPLFNTDTIQKKYLRIKNPGADEIHKFVSRYFIIPGNESNYITDSLSINQHISMLWKNLQRPPDTMQKGTLIPLPYPYIIPGGRFREIYYWDSYFTMLGLQTDDEVEIIENMIDNFSFLIDKYGFIPNGNRSYYLSRSQPPFFSLMVKLLAEIKGDSIYLKYVSQLEAEYFFWMNGEDSLTTERDAYKRIVRMQAGEILNRYWDEKFTPRSESYREDLLTAEQAELRIPGCRREDVFRNLRAAAESGWDFSSRWLLRDANNEFQLYTIHTTDIIPVDLNSLLFNLEYTLSKCFQLKGDEMKANHYRLKYLERRKAILKYCWSQEENFFMDFDFRKEKQTAIFSIAGIYPLFIRIADTMQAKEVAEKLKNSFLDEGGIATSLHVSGQQWDAPNGWAPLQWIAIEGLKNYGFNTLANEITRRWLAVNEAVYKRTYKMMEKYNVRDTSLTGGGGEYPAQDGFGWTNGVYQKLSKD